MKGRYTIIKADAVMGVQVLDTAVIRLCTTGGFELLYEENTYRSSINNR